MKTINPIAILLNPAAPEHIMQTVMGRDVCVRDNKGNVYASCWYSQPPKFEDSTDQLNVPHESATLGTLQDLHKQGRAAILHGFTCMGDVREQLGLEPCNPDGTDLSEEGY